MSTDSELRIHEISRHVHVLGPGERFAIWVQGCEQHCPGCLAPESRSLTGGRIMAVESLARTILSAPGLEGPTVSGGEPFLQAAPLARLIRAVRAERDLGVIVYTGYLLEDLRAGCVPHADELLAVTDLLIDGPYVEALNDGASLRGSSNQRVIPLTERYREALSMYGEPGKRPTEVLVTVSGFFLAGVPSAETLEQVRPKPETGGDAP